MDSRCFGEGGRNRLECLNCASLPNVADIDLGGMSLPVLNRTAAFLLRDGRADLALRFARAAYESDPASLPATLAYTEAAVASGTADNASDVVALLGRHDPSSRWLVRAGDIAEKRGLDDLALYLFERARSIEPGFHYAGHRLARQYEKHERLQEALATLQDCVDRGDDNLHVRATIVELFARTGVPDIARAHLAVWLKKAPDFAPFNHLIKQFNIVSE